MSTRQAISFLVCGALSFPLQVSAALLITEVMYNPEGADTGREWIEIYNDSDSSVSLTAGNSGWKVNDGNNHNLIDPSTGIGRGSLVLSARSALIIANVSSNEDIQALFPGSYSVVKSAINLTNTEAVVSLQDASAAKIDQVAYHKDMGADGDGNSLHRAGAALAPGAPTPGSYTPSSSSAAAASAVPESTQKQTQITGRSSTPSVVPSVSVQIRTNALVSAGAGSVFESVLYDASGKPIESGVRYLWNFGDGTTVEGERVVHTFTYPGSYVVSVTAAYNFSSAYVRATVYAQTPEVSLLAPGDGSLLIANRSSIELDVGNWSLRDSAGAFVIPEGTTILPEGGVRFAPSVLGFSGSLRSVLYFPNGSETTHAQATLDAPQRGESVSAKKMEEYYASAPLIDVPQDVDIYAPALPAEPEEEGEVRGAEDVAPVASSKPLFWGSLAALGGLLGAGVAATHYLQTRRRTPETLPSVEEFEIE